jgi:hypothetical protein
MKANDQLKELEKKAYLSYHEDGIVDLIMGISCLGAALFFATSSVVFNLFTWMPVLFFKPLKNKITFPRIGYVNFDTRRGHPGRITIFMIVTMLLGMLVLGTVFFLNTGRIDPSARAWIGEHFILLLGIIFAAILMIAGFTSSIRRLLIYAAACAISFVASFLFKLPEFAAFLALGIVILCSGILRVVRFVRKYPISAEE